MSGPDDALDSLLGAARARRTRPAAVPAPIAAGDDLVPASPPSSAPDTLSETLGPRPVRRAVTPADEGDPDPLAGLGRGRVGRAAAQVVGAGAEGSGGRGLSPLDMLALPREQQRVIKWLSRQRQGRLDEIAAALDLPAPAVAQVLADLKGLGYVHEAWVDNTLYYRVVFANHVNRAARGVPQGIWDRMAQDNATFLGQIAPFRSLDVAARQALAHKLDTRRYHRNEVILWQGDQSSSILIIKTGVVGVSRLSPRSKEAQLLAYLREGDMVGEYGVLDEQGRAASATVTALSEVDVLVLKGPDFLDLLQAHSLVALELARMLVRRLRANDEQRLARGTPRLCLLFGVQPGVGVTTLGSALALTLAQATHEPAVYTEYPDLRRLPDHFGFPADQDLYAHPGGFHVLVPDGGSDLPLAVRATLLMDALLGQYPNIVIGLPGYIDETTPYLLEQASQVLVLTPPDPAALAQAQALAAQVRGLLRPEKASVAVVINRAGSTSVDEVPPDVGELVIPAVDGLPSLALITWETLPWAFAQVLATLADRLGRTNQVGVYIPTTLGVDEAADTGAYVERTLGFLGALFGGATSSQAQGVWHSERAGLVNETIHVVRSYTTQADLDRHLPAVLEFVEGLKGELAQEAMAVEVNHKMLLL